MIKAVGENQTFKLSPRQSQGEGPKCTEGGGEKLLWAGLAVNSNRTGLGGEGLPAG